MKKEIRDFYTSKELHLSKLIERGKLRNLTKAQVESAAIIIYDRIRSGDEMKTIKIAWEVWALAKLIGSQKILDEDATIEGLKNSLQRRKLYEAIVANILIWGTVIYEIWRLSYAG